MRSLAALQASQRVRFCRSADATRIAYAVHGDGPPLLLDACWLSHLEYDWQSPVWRHYLVELGRVATVVRFDERGHGMSDRDVTDFTLDRRIEDLEAVADHAGLGRFALMAMAQGGPVALHYAHRHPERVTRLVCASTYAAASQHVTDDDRALEDAFQAMIRAGWDRQDPLFRRVFTSMMIPGATEEQMAWLDELHQRSTSARTAYESRVERGKADATGVLPDLALPTLVIHSREERMNDFAHGRTLAATIPNARLVPLDSRNHILLQDEPAWPIFVREITAFLAEDRLETVGAVGIETLTQREREVLDGVAQGLDNQAVAAALNLSVRTIERHLQRIYGKLGLAGPSARAGAVARVLGARTSGSAPTQSPS